MEEILKWVIIVLSGIILICLITYIMYKRGKRKGELGEKMTAEVLKKFSKKHKCKVINGIYLPLYDKTCEIDHIVFGNFGLAVIETKNIGGEVSGSGKYLTHTIGSKKHKLYNPNLQNKTHVDNIRHHLRKGGFEDVPMFAFTVFADKSIKLNSPNIGIKLENLSDKLEYIAKDKKCDYEKMYSYIKSKRVRNPFKKIAHCLLPKSHK